MHTNVALIVVEKRGGPVSALEKALDRDGFEARYCDPTDLLVHPELGAQADLVLASAALGLQRIAILDRHLTARHGPASLLVFPEGDDDALESCVRGGFDFVAPPYLPALLRNRLSTCQERTQLAAAVEEMAAAVQLQEYERELSIAREIASGFLPESLPSRDGWQFSARLRPARQVAGDFYDGFELVNGRRLGFVVADVCDKGVGAALFMALIRTLLRHTAQHTGAWYPMDGDLLRTDTGDQLQGSALSVGAGPLQHAVLGTNRYMAHNHLRQGYFATLFFAVLDPVTGGLLYINGGHNPPVLCRAGGELELLDPTGPAVGVMAESAYVVGRAHLEPGDTLLIYTDGVVEARNVAGGQFGLDLLCELIRDQPSSANALLDHVDDRLRQHVGVAEQFDDITMLAVRRTEQ